MQRPSGGRNAAHNYDSIEQQECWQTTQAPEVAFTLDKGRARSHVLLTVEGGLEDRKAEEERQD